MSWKAFVLPVAGAFAALVAWRPGVARACSCASPGVEVLPVGRTIAPLNARVRVTLPPELVRAEGLTIVLQARVGAPEDPPQVVATETQVVGLASVRVVELRPLAPLAARTRHEVVLSRPGGKQAIVGAFTTGSDEDAEAPRWNGVTRAAYRHPPRVCCDCSTGDPFAELSLSEVEDDRTPATAILYGVWVSDAEGRIDYEQPPLTVARAWSGALRLGHPSVCQPANFSFARNARKMLLGIRPLDLAGNAGKPSSVVIELPGR